jgi:signal transduction histidine kinase
VGRGGDPEVLEAIMRGESGPFTFESSLHRVDGDDVPVRVSVAVVRDDAGEPLYSVTVLESIAEQRRLERQVRQTQKMEAVGQLAGGIAHDFNNLLTVIGGNVLLLGSSDLAPEAREHLEEISVAANRASALTRQLLSFSRAREPNTSDVDLNAVVGEVEGLLRRLIRADVEVDVVLEDGLPTVRTDRGQLEQVLINLAVNARDAMPDGGRLTIGTGRHDGDVLLRVRDTGIGMDELTRERIFEPFFTTKPPGEGTGLGLTNVYGLVVQSGGTIAVDSELGAGTTFTLAFPSADRAPLVVVDRDDAVPVASSTPGRVLFVDDEASVRRLAGAALARAGHDPVLAASGEEALELLGSDQEFNLLVTDLSMPGMTGIELAHEAQELRPGLPVLYVSGYAGGFGDEVAGADVLEKPFSPAVLADRVAQALTAAAAR